jgi:anaerobic magnesium-protoporphyrin IX monomethyl ester cyclase
MPKYDIVLIGFEEQENLGLRYIASHLKAHSLSVAIESYDAPRVRILSQIRKAKPKIVGFSMIFQRFFFGFKELAAYLRKNSISAHFTIGGHFPSMEPQKTLELIPELDSVVRFEGEETLLALCENINDPNSWKMIKGLAYRSDGKIWVNPPRPLIDNLDSLPFPLRKKRANIHRGLGICSILGSRGCFHNCSFCSIHQFYKVPPGPLRRTRSPGNIVKEMEKLFHEQNVNIFIFQDDEWFMKGDYHAIWIEDFVQALKQSFIRDSILWRISCRVDDVRADLIKKMQDVGLMCVYLGIESGNNRGLKTFNKQFTIDDVSRSISVLREVNMPFEFGFMILDPESTFESVLENVAFLESITREGQAVASFSKMVPYAGTEAARRLEKEGRLEGTIASPDYCFRDTRLSILQLFVSTTFNFRNFNRGGAVERLRLAKFDAIVMNKFFQDQYDTRAYEAGVKKVIRQSNDSALETMAMAAIFMKNRTEKEIYRHWPLLERLTQEELARQEQTAASLAWLESSYCAEA